MYDGNLNALRCFKCDRALAYAAGDVTKARGSEANQPHRGTAFRSYGHYGSTYFDMEPGFIEVALCDDCLRANGAQVLHETRRAERWREHTYDPGDAK